MAMKVVINDKDGKSYQKELANEEAEALQGKVLGEEVNGESIGLPGYKLKITGGSDNCGFPMRKDVSGQGRKRILISKSTGFKGKLRGKRFGGLRVRKTIVANTVNENIHQLNIKVTKQGKQGLDKIFSSGEEEEGAQQESSQ